MEISDLVRIVKWIVNRKCKRTDNVNVNVKRAVKEGKQLINITGYSENKLIVLCVKELIVCGALDNINKINTDTDSVFPYISAILYRSVYKTLLYRFQEDYLKELFEEEHGQQ